MESARCSLLLAFSEEYFWPGAVAIDSALRNAPAGLGVVVAVNDLLSDSRHRLRCLVSSHGAELQLRDVTGLVSGLPTVGRYPPITWTRMLVDAVLDSNAERAIYLDADTLVRHDLAPLVELDLEGCTIAAAPDSSMPTFADRGRSYASATGVRHDAPYFNTGLMVMDVQRWVNLDLSQRSAAVARRRSIPLDYVDQDVLNMLLADDWLALDSRWNAPADGDVPDPHVVQFVGEDKPWHGGIAGDHGREFLLLADSLGRSNWLRGRPI